MSDGKLGLPLPDGGWQYEFADGFVCAWSFSEARSSPLRFESAQAARLSWALQPKARGVWISQESLEDRPAKLPANAVFHGDLLAWKVNL